MTNGDSEDFPKEEVKTVDATGGNKRSPVSRINDNSLSKADCTDSDIYRQYYVMQGFAKALWSVLKQYKERVKCYLAFKYTVKRIHRFRIHQVLAQIILHFQSRRHKYTRTILIQYRKKPGMRKAMSMTEL